MMMAIAAKASTMVIFAIIGISNRSCAFGREPISRRGTRLPYSPLVEKPDHAQMREITRTWRRTRRLRLHATLMRDATSGPRALEVSIGIEILGVTTRVGIAEEAGGGCADMCGGVAHACSFQNRPGKRARHATFVRRAVGVRVAAGDCIAVGVRVSCAVSEWSRNAFSIAAKSHTSTL